MLNKFGLLTLEQAARQVGLTRQGLYHYVGRGLEVETSGRFFFVTQEALEAWKRRPVRNGGVRRRKGYAQVDTKQ